MIRPGLVSISFRKLSPAEVCRLAAQAGLEGIEWGGDIHVPVGQLDTAAEVAAMTRDHGLTVAAYGSYHRLGVTEPSEWGQVVATAGALGAKVVRVWCGNVGSAQADAGTRAQVVGAAKQAARLAAEAGVTIACEWHGNTLTDAADSAQALFEAVDHSAFQTYWQPHQRTAMQECLVDMETALPRLAGLHVFQWHVQTAERQALAEGDGVWPAYFQKAAACPALAAGGEMFALLEFVRNDDPANLLDDAKTLHRWLAQLNANR